MRVGIAFAAAIGVALAASCVLDFDRFEGEPGAGGTPAGPASSSTSAAGGGDGGSGGMIPESCTNGALDGNESDVDCGGDCPGCENGASCGDFADCQSQFCDGGTCAACSGDGDCTPAPDTWCDPSNQDGSCVAKKMDGVACSMPNECVSGFCVDGVCCDGACGGMCQACSASLSSGENGSCSPIAGGTDPDNECPGPQVCDGSSGCVDLCGLEPSPPGGTCPSECSGGCNGAQCVIDCTGQSCQGQALLCPSGFSCLVQCGATDSCRNANIQCPESYACDVSCTGASACRNATIGCSGAGACAIVCGSASMACRDADVNCGANVCDVTCPGSFPPNVNCGGSCMCTSC